MIVEAYDRASDLLTISYGPACSASDHAVYAGPLDQVSTYGYDQSRCGLGASGEAQVNVGTGSRFWIITGRNAQSEGSAGKDSQGNERPAPSLGDACSLPQQLGGTCTGTIEASP